MDGMDWKDFEGKRVFIRIRFLNHERVYSGKVLSVSKDHLKLFDKYNQKIIINLSTILEVKEE